MTPDLNAYERSSLNWHKLKAYARRVARETKRPKEVRTVKVRETQTRREIRFFGLITRVVPEDVVQTKHVPQDYWVVDRRYFQKTTILQPEPQFHRTIETEFTEYCLGDDGVIFTHIWTKFESLQILPRSDVINDCHSYPPEPRKPLTDRDVTFFDYYPRYYHSKGNITYDRNDLHGNELRFHAKGVGLSKALGELLK